jgi:CRP-like cAMP-binding protein
MSVRDLSESEWGDIRSAGRVRHYSDGSYLAKEGSVGGAVFAIESGLVCITLVGEGGTQHLIAYRKAGDLIGEMSAIDGLPRSASMVAKGPVVAVVVSAEDFRLFLSSHPDAALRIMQSMARRIRQAATLYVARGGSLSSRIASTLIALVAEGQTVSKANDLVTRTERGIELSLTQQELADWVGASREATARVLAQFRSEELIETHRGGIVVLSPDELAAI